jgi:indolepyruvate ferredoxin oxidoreductase
MGHSIATNIFLLGYAFQKGCIPLSSAALLQAMELNGAAVADNRRAFSWGRRAAHNPAGIQALARAGETTLPTHQLSATLDETIARRREFLAAYQDAAYAQRYATVVDRVRVREAALGLNDAHLATAVARNYFKLLTYKDEYEVARLFSDAEFQRALEDCFEGDYRLQYHITLPWRNAAATGAEPKKSAYGRWLGTAMRLLAHFKFLRGSTLDPFGWQAERKQERRLIQDYERALAEILERLERANLETALALARLPETIRGFGPVKGRTIVQANARRDELLATLRQATAPATRSPAEAAA